MANLLFEENFTSDNSINGQTAPTQAQLAARGWKDGIASVGTGYKFMLDPTLNKNVMYAHWSNATGVRSEPDGTASGWKKFFPATREATLYAVVKFHNVAGSPWGAHWHRFFNLPSAGDYTPGNTDGQMDLDITGRDSRDWLYDPTTKQALPESVNGQQEQRGFQLYAGGSLSYATPGKSNVYQDDVWYEVVWYLKASTITGGVTTVGDGQMRVYIRPLGTTAWVNVFDGKNFVTSKRTDPINFWMIGPYMDRWIADIRHYYSRAVVWSGDALADGTLDTFLGTTAPAPTPTPVPVNCQLSTWNTSGTWTETARVTNVDGSVTVTETQIQTRTIVTQPANGGLPCGPLTQTVTRTTLIAAPPPPVPTPVATWKITSQTATKVVLELL